MPNSVSPLLIFAAVALVALMMFMASRRLGPSGTTRGTTSSGAEHPTQGRASTSPQAAGVRPRIQDATSWGYQLQKLNVARAADSTFDVLVVDYSRDGSQQGALKPAEIERLRTKPDGSRRLVLAYLSVGEAESYRYYWNSAWQKDKPDWLLGENPEWEENYSVCFWQPGWQRLMCGGPDAYLDRILAAGFDGIYLDKCDVYEDLQKHFRRVAKSRPDIEGDMVDFVRSLSAYAKAKDPAFVVVMQNAEQLLAAPELRAAIDGVAKEELLYGLDGPQKRNAKGDIDEARRLLDLARSAGKAVLVVEYLQDSAKIAEAAETIARLGYVLYVAPKDRELDRLNEASLWV